MKSPWLDRADICGVTRTGPTGIEWICVKKVHAKIYQGRNGKMVYDNNPGADRHFYVNRYPNRKGNK